MNQKSQNRLAILRRYMDTWTRMARHNRALVAEIVVEKFVEMGLQDHISGTGVEFTHSDDLCNDMRTHAQKFWRWMGGYDECKPQPDRLWYVEQAIVSAMPEDLRIQYLNEVYVRADLCIAKHQEVKASDPAAILISLIKEGGEAQMAVASLGPDSTREEVAKAVQELKESESATRAAIEAYEQAQGGQNGR